MHARADAGERGRRVRLEPVALEVEEEDVVAERLLHRAALHLREVDPPAGELAEHLVEAARAVAVERERDAGPVARRWAPRRSAASRTKRVTFSSHVLDRLGEHREPVALGGGARADRRRRPARRGDLARGVGGGVGRLERRAREPLAQEPAALADAAAGARGRASRPRAGCRGARAGAGAPAGAPRGG